MCICVYIIVTGDMICIISYDTQYNTNILVYVYVQSIFFLGIFT